MEAEKWGMDGHVDKLLALLTEKDKTQLVGVSRIHRHFTLRENECVTTTAAGENAYKSFVQEHSDNFVPW